VSGRREVMSGTGRLSFSAAGLSVSAGSCHRSLVAFCAVNGSRGLGPGAGPLVVDENSRVLVMEYEAWFGPNAVTFQGSAAMPPCAIQRYEKRGRRIRQRGPGNH
jgi:hypothetical protein